MELSPKEQFWLEVMREFEQSEPKGAVEDARDWIFNTLADFSIPAKEKWISQFGDTFADVPEWFRDAAGIVWSKNPKKRDAQVAKLKRNYHLQEMAEKYGEAPREE